MNHKEQMQWLRENDPITYYELNSNPTGDDDSDSWGCFIPVIILVGFLILGALAIYFKQN